MNRSQITISITIVILTVCTTSISMSPLTTPTAHADDMTPGLPWSDQKTYQECGQSCLYNKGNENIILQTSYEIQKINALKPLTDTDKDEIYALIGPFCQNSSGETAEQCKNRYIAESTLRLYKARTTMLKNNESAQNLSSVGPDSAPILARPSATLKPQVTYVPTLAELEAEYKRRDQRLATGASESYRRWAENLPHPPSKEDFYKIKTIPRDPNNPGAGSFETVGELDEAGYRKAVELYQKNNDVAKWADPKNMAKYKPTPEAFQKLNTPKDMPVTQAQKIAFWHARHPVVDAANRSIGKIDGFDATPKSDTTSGTKAKHDAKGKDSRSAHSSTSGAKGTEKSSPKIPQVADAKVAPNQSPLPKTPPIIPDYTKEEQVASPRPTVDDRTARISWPSDALLRTIQGEENTKTP